MKICNKCKTQKLLEFFSKSRKEKDGHQYTCKQCKKKIEKDMRDQNPEKYREIRVKYVYENKEKEINRKSEWRKKNVNRIREYRLENLDYFRERSRLYAKNNSSIARYHCSKSRSLKKNASVSWANKEKILSIYRECVRISEETGVKHHVDHIIPLTHKLVYGLHVENNLQIITAAENLRKNNKFQPH